MQGVFDLDCAEPLSFVLPSLLIHEHSGNWLKMDLDELERNLPKDELAALVLGEGESTKLGL